MLESENQNVHIAFTSDEIKNYQKYYFQINIDNMSFYFQKSNCRLCKVEWLFGNRQDSLAEAKRFEDEYIFDSEKLNETCQRLIDRIFEPDGLIDKCIKKAKLI